MPAAARTAEPAPSAPTTSAAVSTLPSSSVTVAVRGPTSSVRMPAVMRVSPGAKPAASDSTRSSSPSSPMVASRATRAA
ncbi:MAG: hypothetical protein MUC68_18180 [Burkholderiaceae bacterium]|nr:hypothetical protein [Burkholderiaceae bacterium]